MRSSIEYQERSGPASCPQCRDRCDAADLRLAPQLRAIAAAFAAARPLLLVRVRMLGPESPFPIFLQRRRVHTQLNTLRSLRPRVCTPCFVLEVSPLLQDSSFNLVI